MRGLRADYPLVNVVDWVNWQLNQNDQRLVVDIRREEPKNDNRYVVWHRNTEMILRL
jgi:hypothetical protein